MFGGQRNSKSSDILRSANVDRFNSNASYGAAGGSVNDSLFQKIEDAEKHAKMIITDGQSKYVDGIKQNVIELVYGWLSGGIGNNIFTLFGKMESLTCKELIPVNSIV